MTQEKPTSPEPKFHTATEEEILRALWNHRRDFLVRSQVHANMALPPRERPTTARIGQILKNLYDHGYVDRELDRFQGCARAAFYQLNRKGIEKCLSRYDFRREESVLFHTEEEDRQKYLTPRYFQGSHDSPVRRIVGFYAFSGGFGQTTMIAHTARQLALQAARKKILVVDLDTNTPDLDRFFPRAQDTRGLRGLLVDFQKKPDWQKKDWIRQALSRKDYVGRPRPRDHPNLYYLRSGLADAGSKESGAALGSLREELGLGGRKQRLPEDAYFLKPFREALREEFALVLANVRSGQNAGAIALPDIADQLVVNVRPDDSPQSLDGLRSFLAWYFREREAKRGDEPGAGILLTLYVAEIEAESFDGGRWIQENIYAGSVDRSSKSGSWILPRRQLPRDPTEQGLARLYMPLVRILLGKATETRYVAPERKVIREMLNPEASPDRREMMASYLENSSLDGFGKHLEALIRNGSTLSTDEKGLCLLEAVFEAHCRRILGELKTR